MTINLWEIIKYLLLILRDLWPLWLILLAVLIFQLIFSWLDLKIDNWHLRRKFKKGETWRSDRDLLHWLRGMKPSEFEDYITDLFSRLGAVRDFYGALADHLANGQGYFITTNKFTLEARKFAEDKPIELIDGFELIRYIRMAKKDDKPNAMSAIKPSGLCPKCGGKLVERTGKFGIFYGCSNYPRCKYTINKK
jgi:hypothetical protein